MSAWYKSKNVASITFEDAREEVDECKASLNQFIQLSSLVESTQIPDQPLHRTFKIDGPSHLSMITAIIDRAPLHMQDLKIIFNASGFHKNSRKKAIALGTAIGRANPVKLKFRITGDGDDEDCFFTTIDQIFHGYALTCPAPQVQTLALPCPSYQSDIQKAFQIVGGLKSLKKFELTNQTPNKEDCFDKDVCLKFMKEPENTHCIHHIQTFHLQGFLLCKASSVKNLRTFLQWSHISTLILENVVYCDDYDKTIEDFWGGGLFTTAIQPATKIQHLVVKSYGHQRATPRQAHVFAVDLMTFLKFNDHVLTFSFTGFQNIFTAADWKRISQTMIENPFFTNPPDFSDSGMPASLKSQEKRWFKKQ